MMTYNPYYMGAVFGVATLLALGVVCMLVILFRLLIGSIEI